MSEVRIMLAPSAALVGAFCSGADIAFRQFEKSYQTLPVMQTTWAGEDAAEEMFDLTNNPCRQEERLKLYGNMRSVSVGDVVEVDGVKYLCEPAGWSVF
jgi:hypothetical protein